MARPTTPAEAEADAMANQRIADIALSAFVRHGPLMDALQSGSFGGDVTTGGFYNDDDEWVEYMRYGIDAYDSGKGMAP